MSPLAYIQEKSGVKNSTVIVSLALVLLLLFGAVYIRFQLSGVLFIVGALFFAYFFAWRAETFPVIFLFYMALFPIQKYSEQFEILPIYFANKTIFVFVILAFFILFFQKEMNPLKKISAPYQKDAVGFIVLLFLAWMIVQTFYGLSRNYKDYAILMEVHAYSLIFTYFFWRALFRWKHHERKWLNFIALLGIITAIEYIGLVAFVFRDIVTFVLVRNITRQSQMIIASFPIVASIFMMNRSWRIKTISIIAIMLLTIQAFLTQQRTIWLTFAAMIFIFFTLVMFRKGITYKSFLRWLGVTFLLSLALIGLLVLAAWFFDTDMSILLKRWETVQNLTDSSFLMRIIDSRHAIEEVGKRWLIGLGVGRELQVIPSSSFFYFFDVSYLTVFYKGGVPATILLTLIYLGGIYRAFQVFQRTNSNKTQYYAIAIITVLAGQMISGITTVSMIYYRFVFIWMMFVAAAVVLYERLKEEQTETEQAHG